MTPHQMTMIQAAATAMIETGGKELLVSNLERLLKKYPDSEEAQTFYDVGMAAVQQHAD